MDFLTLLVVALAAVLAGAAGGAVLAGRRTAAQMDTLRRAGETASAERAVLQERLAARELRAGEQEAAIARLQQAEDALRLQLGDVRQHLADASARREEAARGSAERDAALARAQERETALRAELSAVERQFADLKARQEEVARANQEKLEELARLREQFKGTFAELSNAALKDSKESFLKLAQESLAKLVQQGAGDLDKRKVEVEGLVKPLQETLAKVSTRIEETEVTRAKAFTELNERIQNLMQNEQLLRRETATLAEALRKPSVRGAWGELQLRRVVEFAGMVDHCHFHEQVTVGEGDRPDMVVSLPNGHKIVVDSKAPMQAYLDALNASDEAARKTLMERHVAQLRDKVRQLGQKRYSEQFEQAPEFVVLFLPSEALFSTALDLDPNLLDFGLKSRVVLATPTTLIALLLAVSCGWQQHQVAENARQMGELGRELYERIGVFAEKYATIGKRLEGAVKAYNESVASMEGRLLVTARKLNSLGGFDREQAALPGDPTVDLSPRMLTAAELTSAEPGVRGSE